MHIKTVGGSHPKTLDIEDKLQGVYILHYSRSIDRNIYPKYKRYGGRKHYVGQSKDIVKRVQQHKSGEGAEITQACLAHGIELALTSVFPVGLLKEEQIITRIGAEKFCSVCQMEKLGTTVLIDNKYATITAKYNLTCSMCGKAIRKGSLAGVHKENSNFVHYFHIRTEV